MGRGREVQVIKAGSRAWRQHRRGDGWGRWLPAAWLPGCLVLAGLLTCLLTCLLSALPLAPCWGLGLMLLLRR